MDLNGPLTRSLCVNISSFHLVFAVFVHFKFNPLGNGLNKITLSSANALE